MKPPIRVRSREAFQRACRVLPGGVNSPARAFGGVGGQPIVVARGEGPYLFDIDGNRYLDYVGSWGPLILGHAHPRVVKAVGEALAKGASFGAPTERETELAELIGRQMPSIEMVRMVSSGTEAAMSAVRLARGFTGRDVVVKFAATGSTITQATRSSSSGTVLYGATSVSATAPAGTPAEPASPSVATPLPPAASRASEWPW